MYSFRSEKGLSAWHLSGLAIRTAVELGLHRKTPQNKLKDPFVEETRKRVWWSVYCLERFVKDLEQSWIIKMDAFVWCCECLRSGSDVLLILIHWTSVFRTMALQLGRPIAIQDSDIDIEVESIHTSSFFFALHVLFRLTTKCVLVKFFWQITIYLASLFEFFSFP